VDPPTKLHHDREQMKTGSHNTYAGVWTTSSPTFWLALNCPTYWQKKTHARGIEEIWGSWTVRSIPGYWVFVMRGRGSERREVICRTLTSEEQHSESYSSRCGELKGGKQKESENVGGMMVWPSKMEWRMDGLKYLLSFSVHGWISWTMFAWVWESTKKGEN